jgi:hypothetical protein
MTSIEFLRVFAVQIAHGVRQNSSSHFEEEVDVRGHLTEGGAANVMDVEHPYEEPDPRNPIGGVHEVGAVARRVHPYVVNPLLDIAGLPWHLRQACLPVPAAARRSSGQVR